MGKLENKVAVVTGGNSGIGLATARTFIDEGARVVIFGRDQKTLDRAVETLGENAVGVTGDVSLVGDIDRLFETAKESFGKIDILFVNAGIAEFAPIDRADEAHFDRIVDINFKGAYFTVQRALDYLADGASIIFNSSVVNAIGLPNSSVYSATKAALRSLARTLSQDLAPRGIRVNTVSPGLTESPLLGRLNLSAAELAAFGEQVVEQTPLKRLGAPQDIANATLFLAGTDSSFVTGAELAVDGGFAQV